MKYERNTSAMVEAALVALIVTVVILTVGYIPLIGYLTAFMPALFSVVWIRRGRHYGMLSVCVSSILTFILGFPMESFLVLAYGGIIAGFMSEGIRLELKTSQVILLGAIGAALSSVVVLSFTELLTGIGVTQIFTEAIEETKTFINTAQIDPTIVADLNTQMETIGAQMQSMLPFILIVSGMITAVINHWAIYKGLKRIRHEISKPGRFRDFTLPKNVFVGSLMMMALSWLSGMMGFNNSEVLFMNVLLVVVLVFSIQGAAVSVFLMYRQKFPRAVIVAFSVFGILFYSMLQFPLFILGMLEAIINLRDRMRSNA